MRDKLGFLRWSDTIKINEELRHQIEELIREEQRTKRLIKAELEMGKEANIKRLDAINRPLEREKIEMAKEILHRYQHEVNQLAGWRWPRLKAKIVEKLGDAVVFNEAMRGYSGTVLIQHKDTLHILYVVCFGDDRVVESELEPSTSIVRVYRNVSDPTKEYVKDSRGILTRRYVSRACNIDQIEALFRDGAIKPRNTTRDAEGEFDFNERISVIHSERDHKVILMSRSKQRNGSSLNNSMDLTDAELDFLQVRDGSGNNQRALSATAVITSDKVVRGNKGERFDDGPAFAAVIIIDLAKLQPQEIRNQYADEAHQFKVSYPRIDPSDKNRKIKRFAKDELSEYIYSVQKNREILLTRVPLCAVYAVLPVGSTQWMPLEAAKPYFTKMMINRMKDRARGVPTNAARL